MIFPSRIRFTHVSKGVYDLGLTEKACALCLLGLLSTAHGAENEHGPEQSLELPDLEFLEFLGQFETDAGEWIEPISLMGEDYTFLLNAALIQDPNSSSTDIDDDNVQQNNE